MSYENVKIEKETFSCNGSGIGTLVKICENGEVLKLFIYPEKNSLGLKYSLHLGDKIVLLNVKEDGTYFCPSKMNGKEIKVPININELEKIIELEKKN